MDKGHEFMNKFNDVLRKGQRLWQYMNQRCYNKKNTGYAYYGGAGIKISMSYDEFMYWFINNAKDFDKLSYVSIGRKDHKKDYCLSNIKTETVSENSKESYSRNGRFTIWKPRGVIVGFPNGKTEIFSSISEAGRAVHYDISTISKICRGKGSRNKSGLTFNFLELK